MHVSFLFHLSFACSLTVMSLVQQSKGPLPPQSEHPSRPSITTLEDMIKDSLDGSGEDYSLARRRVRRLPRQWCACNKHFLPQAKLRDRFRCMVTARYDIFSVRKYSVVKAAQRAANGECKELHYCHIISQSTLQNADPENPQHDRKARTLSLAILHIY